MWMSGHVCIYVTAISHRNMELPILILVRAGTRKFVMEFPSLNMDNFSEKRAIVLRNQACQQLVEFIMAKYICIYL